MVDLVRTALSPMQFLVTSLDNAMAAGALHNAREAAHDGDLRRQAWSTAMHLARAEEERRTRAASGSRY